MSNNIQINKQLGFDRSKIIFLGICVLGFGLLFWSAVDWYELMRGSRTTPSFCSINSFWNCDRVTMSKFGSFSSVPVGLLGALWFLVTCALGLSAKIRSFFRAWLILGVLAAGFLAYQLFFVLKAGCIICLLSDLCILLALYFGWKISGAAMKAKTLFILTALAVLLMGFYGWYRTSHLEDFLPEGEFDAWYGSLATVSVASASPLQKGSASGAAKIRVMEFSDFGCPYCARAAQILVPYLAMQENVSIEFFPFPLDSSCNSSMTQAVHPRSCEWTRAVLCGVESGRAWDMHDRIFKIASTEGDLPPVTETLKSWGLENLSACISDPKTNEQLRLLIQVGIDLRVNSTPTFIVNGKLIRGFIPLPLMKRVIKEAQK